MDLLTAKLWISETGAPSSARRIAGAATSAKVTAPFPKLSTASTHAAAAPNEMGKWGSGTSLPGYFWPAYPDVTEFKSSSGMDFPVIPRSFSFSMLRDFGDLPEPFKA